MMMITSLILLIMVSGAKFMHNASGHSRIYSVLTFVFYISPELQKIKLILMMKSAPLIHRITWRINLMQIAGMTPTCKKVNLNQEDIHQEDEHLQGSLVNKKNSRPCCKNYLRLPRERKPKMLMRRRMLMDLYHKA